MVRAAYRQSPAPSPAVRPRDPIVAERARAGLAVLPTNLVQQPFANGPTVALNLVLPGAAGTTAAALFGISRKIASLIQFLRVAFAHVLAPVASAARRNGSIRCRRSVPIRRGWPPCSSSWRRW